MFNRTIFMVVMPWSSAAHDSMITCNEPSTRDTNSILFDFYHSEYTFIFSLGLMINGRIRSLNINEHTNEICYTITWSKNTIKFELIETNRIL
jgi:hypothetical protein